MVKIMKVENKPYLPIIILIICIFCSVFSIYISNAIVININFSGIVGFSLFFLIMILIIFNYKNDIYLYYLSLLCLPGIFDDLMPQVKIGYEYEAGFTTFPIFSLFDLLLIILIYKYKNREIRKNIIWILIIMILILDVINFTFSIFNYRGEYLGVLFRGTLLFVRLSLIYILLVSIKIDKYYFMNLSAYVNMSILILSLGSFFLSIGKERFVGGYYGMNIFANFLVMLTLISFGFFLIYKTKLNVFYLITTIIGLIIILLTQTRMALLSLLFGFLLMILLLNVNYRKKLSLLLLGSLSLVIISIYLLNTSQFTRLLVLISPIDYLQNVDLSTNTTLGTRLLLWEATLQMVKDNLFFGIGAGMWNFVRYEYGVSFPVLLDSHNSYLGIMSEYGIIIFILYMFFIILCIYKSIQNIKKESEVQTKNVQKVYLIAVICWLLTELSNAGIYKVSIHIFVWTILLSLYLFKPNRDIGENIEK